MEQLLLTLRIYATGSFLITMGDFCGVSTTSAHYIVHRVSAAIARLRPRYIRFPNTEEEIRNEQLQFYNIARFPRVIGCIDCTHIRVQSFGKLLRDYFTMHKIYLLNYYCYYIIAIVLYLYYYTYRIIIYCYYIIFNVLFLFFWLI